MSRMRRSLATGFARYVASYAHAENYPENNIQRLDVRDPACNVENPTNTQGGTLSIRVSLPFSSITRTSSKVYDVKNSRRLWVS